MKTVTTGQEPPTDEDDLEQMSDPRLVTRVRGGDVDAFEVLYRRHVGRVYAICLRLLGDAATAEDLTQECFMRCWRKIHSFRGDSAFGTWLHRLATNAAISELRRRPGWQVEADDGIAEPGPSVPSTAPLQRDLERAVAELPDGARTVLVLHDIEGHTHGEIAALTGLAVGTSKAQLHRARERLKRILQ
jgi:RNA polymerase sigma-70 factor (ECF subfamily)